MRKARSKGEGLERGVVSGTVRAMRAWSGGLWVLREGDAGGGKKGGLGLH